MISTLSWNERRRLGERRGDASLVTGKRKKRFEYLLDKLEQVPGMVTYDECMTKLKDEAPPLDWEALPRQLNPMFFMRPGRAIRKQLQVENIVALVAEAVRLLGQQREEPLHVVDFCSSSGHTGFILAYLFPTIRVTLVEHAQIPVNKARLRNQQLGLHVHVFHGSITEFDLLFDIGVGVHACGLLSDWIIHLSLRHQAAYILCPCCVGKIPLMMQNDALHLDRRRPYSDVLQKVYTESEFYALCRHGDYGGWEAEENASQNAKHRRLCKTIVECDRNLLALSHGYTTTLTKMKPLHCTPKNDLLMGIPPK